MLFQIHRLGILRKIPSVKTSVTSGSSTGFLPFWLRRPALNSFTVFCCLLLLVVALDGCLIYQTVEYQVQLNPDGKSGTVTVKCSNIESSSDEASKQNDDFQELLSKWKSDQYLLERMNEGVYVKRRDLELRHGILVWQEIGIFADVQKMKDGISYEDTTRISLGKDETVLSTNGTEQVSKDSTVVLWPPHTRDFHIKIRNQDFKPSSHFVEKFKLFTKKRK